MLSNSCNYQCAHCMVNSTREILPINIEVVEKYKSLVKSNNPQTISFVGGEPTLYLDTIEDIANALKSHYNSILIYSNGTFLLDSDKRKRISRLHAIVRISKTPYHKDFWTPELEKLISNSPYWTVDTTTEKDQMLFPRGRALTNSIYTNQSCPCSLVNGDYDGHIYSNRFLVMPDGSVNIWCPCLSVELANVFIDSKVTHELLVAREELLREYLIENNMFYDDMVFMCNEVCNKFKVTKVGIYRDGELMKRLRCN